MPPVLSREAATADLINIDLALEWLSKQDRSKIVIFNDKKKRDDGVDKSSSGKFAKPNPDQI